MYPGPPRRMPLRGVWEVAYSCLRIVNCIHLQTARAGCLRTEQHACFVYDARRDMARGTLNKRREEKVAVSTAAVRRCRLKVTLFWTRRAGLWVHAGHSSHTRQRVLRRNWRYLYGVIFQNLKRLRIEKKHDSEIETEVITIVGNEKPKSCHNIHHPTVSIVITQAKSINLLTFTLFLELSC